MGNFKSLKAITLEFFWQPEHAENQQMATIHVVEEILWLRIFM
jgi:hypothetical protein